MKGSISYNRLLLVFVFLLGLVSNAKAAVYYVDDLTGNDSNSGLSTTTAWRTLSHVSSFALVAGDSVKFKRGGIFRGQLFPKNGNSSNYIVYTSYGTGNKPALLGSVNWSLASDWIDEGGNIWRSSSTSSVDIGNLIFNNATIFGSKKWASSNLTSQGDYWWDKFGTQVVKIYSVSNPATFYSEIEAAMSQHIVFAQVKSYIIFENLALKYGAAMGFEIENTHHTVIKDCDISYIGGGELTGQIRYGNAIQYWASSNNNTVKRCRIWEIYDTGITNQSNNSAGIAQQYNLYYTNNIIWNCSYAAFEIWLNAFGTSSLMKNIYFDNNTCVNTGGGWGNAERPDHFLESGAGSAIYLGHTTAVTDSIFIRNNIFHEAHCIMFANNEGIETLLETEMDYNNWYRENSTDTIAVFYTTSTIDLWVNSQFANYQSTNLKDVNSITTDPLLIDPNWDFRLTSTSPCIDAGTNTGISYDFDFTTVPQNSLYDIGAYEYFVGMGIENEQVTDILVYPNPTTGIFQINTSNTQPLLLYVYDMMGKVVYQKQIMGAIVDIDLSAQTNGIYLIQLYEGHQRVFQSKILLVH